MAADGPHNLSARDQLAIPPVARLVVWWRQPRSVVEVPRRHLIGWCDATGRCHGCLVITSHHLRLDRRQIHTALAVELAGHFPTPPTLAPAHESRTEISNEASLRVDGFRIIEMDLTSVYGLNVVAGITAQLLARGVDASVVVDWELSDPVRDATCHAAAQALGHFRRASPTDLYEAGWTRASDERWQLLLSQR